MKLSPAESAMLLEPSHAEAWMLLKYTLMGLLLKQVITIVHQDAKSKDGQRLPNQVRERLHTFLVLGANHGKVALEAHEQLLVGILEEESKINIRRLMWRVLQKLGNVANFKTIWIYGILRKKGYLSFWSIARFNWYNLSAKGKAYKQQILQLIEDIEKAGVRKAQQPLLKGMASKLGANILLIDPKIAVQIASYLRSIGSKETAESSESMLEDAFIDIFGDISDWQWLSELSITASSELMPEFIAPASEKA